MHGVATARGSRVGPRRARPGLRRRLPVSARAESPCGGAAGRIKTAHGPADGLPTHAQIRRPTGAAVDAPRLRYPAILRRRSYAP